MLFLPIKRLNVFQSKSLCLVQFLYLGRARLKMFVESLGMNPNEVLAKDTLVMPHRTVADPEYRKIEVLNEALKHAILKELRNA